MSDDGFRGLRLTNTMTRSKEDLRPLDWREGSGVSEADRRVRLYVCGPTVYDFAHIGNARPVIVFDVLYRLLRHLYGSESVTYVRNITDVDDKINARAARDFPGLALNEAIRRVTEPTAAQFQRDAEALGCLVPDEQPRATDFVTPRGDGKPDMVSMIETLIAKGHAYEAAGEVLFDVTSMPDYGRLSNRRLDEQQAGARVAVDAHKRNPGDFVLWKLSSAGEPGWESPWGQEAWTAAGRTGTPKGRPGWHIECSVMSEAYLGAVFDIHGGGLDLIFPHHENEIAQSRCAHGTSAMAEIWMHNGFLQVEGKKMSKSDGNFVTIDELLSTDKFGGRAWPGEVLRLAMLMTHYREPIDFSLRRLEEAEAILKSLRTAASAAPTTRLPDRETVQALLDDLDVGSAIRRLQSLRRNVVDEAGHSNAARLAWGLEFLGFPADFGNEDLFPDLADEREISAAVEARLELLRAKNFAEADRIRDDLLAKGIQLKDGKDPATGERVTTWEVRR
jgi:cysteinyl-tRNA synthetase